MSKALLSQPWHIQLYEPATADDAARIRVQEEYLGAHLAPWLAGTSSHWLADLHSYHFMRYLDPDHLGNIRGIAIVLRFLGTQASLQRAESEVRSTLESHKASHSLFAYEEAQSSDWSSAVLSEYGGPDVGEAFARFLAAASFLTLRLLSEPRRDFQSRVLITENWSHCLGLVTRGQG